MSARQEALLRATNFCDSCGLSVPILMAPMAGACPASLAIAVGQAGGLGACGALLMDPDAIKAWTAEVRAGTNGAFQLNLWIPDPEPERNMELEADVRSFLANWGPEVPPDAGDVRPMPFEAQCEAILEAGPAIVSSIMGLFPESYVAQMKARGIKWFCTVTTVTEAKAAVEAGADVVVAQGMEAGGHRGSFEADRPDTAVSGLFALLPAVFDAVGDRVPVVATGGIADGRTIATAMLLGASAVQIGTGLLRTPEANLSPGWAEGLAHAQPEDTMLTRAFSGRLGRSLATGYVIAASAPHAPKPAPYPVQRGLTGAMRAAAGTAGDLDRMQAWAGQAARLASTESATDYVRRVWDEAERILT